MKRILPIFLLAVMVAGGCARKCDPWEALRNHEAVTVSAVWDPWLRQDVPVEERVHAAPPFLVDYLRLDNECNGYEGRPESELPDPAFLADIKSALAELPAGVRTHVDRHLIGIFTVSGLGSTGYTDLPRSLTGARRGFIVLSIDALHRKANEWASWLANSAFRDAKDAGIELAIEDASSDNRKQAIQYIILHEVGHVVGGILKLHPDWSVGGDPARYDFSKISWTRTEQRVRSRFEEDFPLRSRVTLGSQRV